MAEVSLESTRKTSALDELEVGYFELFRNNPTYTRFWLSFLISFPVSARCAVCYTKGMSGASIAVIVIIASFRLSSTIV